MKTILLADAQDTGLEPLTDGTCKALLPVAGKPVIAHALESLYRAGIREACVFAGSNRKLLEGALEGGTPWGMQLSIRPDSDFMERLAGAQAEGGLLLVRGDVLVDLDLGGLLQEARELGRGITVRDGRGASVALVMRCTGKEGNGRRNRQRVLPEEAVNSLESLQDFHRANLDVMRGKFGQLSPAGIELSYGIWSEPGASLDRERAGPVNVFIGSASRVHREARFDGDSVIGERVLVDRRARMCDTVILPDTYVGAFTDLGNSIVRGNLLIRVDTGVIAEIGDRHVLADISPARRAGGLGRRLLSAWRSCA